MRTIVYIDGFNLYYGCLKHSDDKWLDIVKLFSQILNAQCPQFQIEKIKFFTADIKAKVATHGDLAQRSQQDYHRALLQCYPEKIEIIKGHYSLEKANLPRYKDKKHIDKTDKVEVWRLEEKKTDVNLALSAYQDASKKNVEQLVFVTNDSDIAPALEFINSDFPGYYKIGIIFPIRKPQKNKKHRPLNISLRNLADWTRSYITEEELANCWLPDSIPTNKKPILKPDYWEPAKNRYDS